MSTCKVWPWGGTAHDLTMIFRRASRRVSRCTFGGQPTEVVGQAGSYCSLTESLAVRGVAVIERGMASGMTCLAAAVRNRGLRA